MSDEHRASMAADPKPENPVGSPAAGAKLVPKAVSDQVRMRYTTGSAFSTHGEMKRLVLFVLGALGLVAIVGQFQWNRMKMQEDLKKDAEKWEKRQAALAAGPQPGQGVVGGEIKWDNMLAEEKDDSSLDDITTDKGFKYLVRHLSNMKPGEKLPQGEGFDYEDLLLNPAKHRGNVVSLYGLVNKVYANILIESNQGPYSCVYRLYLVDLSGTKSCIVDVLERPDGIDLRNAVEAEGIFIRTHKYETQDSKFAHSQVVRVPYFLAQRVTRVQRTQSRTMWSPGVTIGVVAACVVLFVTIFLVGRSGGRNKKLNSQVSSNAL